MKIFKLLGVVVLTGLLLSACRPPSLQQTVVGSNRIDIESRPVGSIDAVEMSGFGRLVITQGEGESLTVEAEDNFLKYLVTEMRGTTLVIRLKPLFSFKPNQPIIYCLTVRSLERMQLGGFSEAEVSGLAGQKLDVRLNEFSKLTLNDLDVRDFQARISGFSHLTANGIVASAAVEQKESAAYEAAGLTLR